VRRVRKLQCAAARSPFTMAPKRGLSIERTTEYEDFMKDLAAFHEKRGYVTWCAATTWPVSVTDLANAVPASNANPRSASGT